MNLEAIQKAMEELRVAKEEIARLQQSRKEAEKNVKKALDLVDSVKDKSESTSNYSDEAYWENRYKGSKDPKQDVYEWYVSFDQIEATFKEDIANMSVGSKSLILVSGCGNSTLCEDFVNKGFVNVHGMDYSSSVIKNMQERSNNLNLASIKYFQADARYMPDISSGHYDVLFDKGTLDAIASSAGDANTGGSRSSQVEEDSVDALNYICEIWRVLRIGGLFILISTMPPEIIEPLALTPLLQPAAGSASETSKRSSNVSNWNAGCRVLPLTTQEGGTVYYYAITKVAEISRLTSYRPGTNAGATAKNDGSATATTSTKASSNLKTTDTSGIMAGIAALLEEAKKAKEAMEAASNQQRQAAAEVREVENKRASLEQTLQSGLREMGRDSVGTNIKSTDKSNAHQQKRYKAKDDKEEEELGMSHASAPGNEDRGNDFDADLQGDSEEKRHNEAIIQNAIEAAVRKVAPVVKVFLDQQASSALVADGSVEVFYLLHHAKPVSTGATSTSSGWSEDDTVNLVCRGAAGTAAAASSVVEDALCYKEDEQPYETFEYTNPPRLLAALTLLSPSDLSLLQQIGALDYITKVSKAKVNAPGLEHQFYLGQVSVKLPSVGGSFHFSYVRTLTLPATAVTIYDASSNGGSGKVVQRRVILAQSAPVAPRVPLHGAHPDARGAALSVLFGPSPSSNSVDMRPTTIRRRGAGALVNAAVSAVRAFPAELTMWVEDLSHIGTLNVVTALRTKDSYLARTMVWVQQSTTTEHTLQLVVEADVITPVLDAAGSGGDRSARVRTVYGMLQITDDIFKRACVDLRSAYGHLDQNGRFVCRLPYILHDAKKVTTSRETAAASDNLQPFVDMSVVLNNLRTSEGNNKHASISVQCGFCSAEVLTSESIQALRPLPTGLLDNMMHDFICCEVLPENGLTSTDLETPQHTLLYGPLYASVHPAHLSPCAVQLQCKTHSTALDVFTGCGGALATAPIPLGSKSSNFGATMNGNGKNTEAVLSKEQRRAKVLQAFKTVINIDTCSISCARCTSYLGDAHLQGESCDRNCAVHTTTTANVNADSSATDLAVAHTVPAGGQPQDFEVTDLRDVRFALPAVQFSVTAARRSSIHTKAEQFVARCVLHINTTFNLSSFCLYVADADFGKLKKETIGVILKLVSPEYRISQSSNLAVKETDPVSVQLVDCIKVSFAVGEVVETLAGNEARLPVEYQHLREVIALLQTRSDMMGPSPFKGQALSYLCK